jgi:hypothetical protein
MSITLTCLELVDRYTEKPWRPAGGTALSGDDLRQVEASVAPILQELETLRRETVRRIDRRVIWMAPGGALAGAFLSVFVFEHGDLWSLVIYVLMGGVLGWCIAFQPLHNAYRRAYKGRILPHLAGRFGDLSYRAAQEPNLQRLARLGIVPLYGKKCVEDEIFGAYRGVQVNIVEAKLETGGKNSSVVFNGLLVEVLLPGRLSGTTLIVKDSGVLGFTLGEGAPDSALKRVRLEDPQFEQCYQVYGTDQIGARAFLTPAVMERLMALGVAREPPRLLAENGTLRIAMGGGPRENHFEPPSLASPVRGGDQLLQLSADIGSVLKLIDAVLDISPTIRPDPVALAREAP